MMILHIEKEGELILEFLVRLPGSCNEVHVNEGISYERQNAWIIDK